MRKSSSAYSQLPPPPKPIHFSLFHRGKEELDIGHRDVLTVTQASAVDPATPVPYHSPCREAVVSQVQASFSEVSLFFDLPSSEPDDTKSTQARLCDSLTLLSWPLHHVYHQNQEWTHVNIGSSGLGQALSFPLRSYIRVDARQSVLHSELNYHPVAVLFACLL